MKVFKEKAQIQQGVPIDLFFSIPQCKKLPKNLEVTKFQRIFAEDCAALGNLKAAFIALAGIIFAEELIKMNRV